MIKLEPVEGTRIQDLDALPTTDIQNSKFFQMYLEQQIHLPDSLSPKILSRQEKQSYEREDALQEGMVPHALIHHSSKPARTYSNQATLLSPKQTRITHELVQKSTDQTQEHKYTLRELLSARLSETPSSRRSTFN